MMQHKRIIAALAAAATAATVCVCAASGAFRGDSAKNNQTPAEPEKPAQAITAPTVTVFPATVQPYPTVKLVTLEKVKPAIRMERLTLYDVPLDAGLQRHIIATAEAFDIDPALILAIIKKESNYNADAVGDSGRSEGLMQVQRRWHSARMDRLGCTDLLDAYENVTVGTDFLAELLATYGDTATALVVYNQGSYKGTVTSYATSVLANYETIKGGKKEVVYRSDDPLRDFENYDAAQCKMLEELPTCEYCGDEIQDDYYYEINDEPVCAECLERYFKKCVEQ